MKYGVRFSDVRKEFVAQSLPFARAFYEACDVHNLNGSGHRVLRLDNVHQLLQAFIWHIDDPQIGLNGAEWKVCTLRLGVGQTVKEGGFANVGQSDNAAFQGHGRTLLGAQR